MPIKNLTNKNLAFPEIGQIRKGAPKQGNKPGKDLPYFRVVFDEAETAAAATFRKVYGEKPVEINILLPFNELERVWEAWLEAYTAGRMVARADGEKFIYLLDTETGEVVVRNGVDVNTGQPRPYVEGQPVGYYTDKRGQRQPIYCKPVGRLKVVIPELRRLAYLTVLTTSIHDIANLDAQLNALQRVNGGRIAGIPLVLRRRPKKVSVPKPNGQRVRMTKYLLSIEADERWVRQAVAAMEAAARPALAVEDEAVGALPAGNDTTGDTTAGEDVLDGEFTPVETAAENAPNGDEAAPMGTETATNAAKSAPNSAESAPNGDEAETQPERPYDPETLQMRIRGLVQYWASRGVTEDVDGKKGVLVKLLETTFNGSKPARYALSAYLLGKGKESTKAWTPAETQAMWRWFAPTKDEESGEWLPDPQAVQEAVKAYHAALEAQGQQAIPF